MKFSQEPQLRYRDSLAKLRHFMFAILVKDTDHCFLVWALSNDNDYVSVQLLLISPSSSKSGKLKNNASFLYQS